MCGAGRWCGVGRTFTCACTCTKARDRRSCYASCVSCVSSSLSSPPCMCTCARARMHDYVRACGLPPPRPSRLSHDGSSAPVATCARTLACRHARQHGGHGPPIVPVYIYGTDLSSSLRVSRSRSFRPSSRPRPCRSLYACACKYGHVRSCVRACMRAGPDRHVGRTRDGNHDRDHDHVCACPSRQQLREVLGTRVKTASQSRQPAGQPVKLAWQSLSHLASADRPAADAGHTAMQP